MAGTSALDALTEKQRIFVIEYAADGDRSRALKEAGYQSNLAVQGVRLLANPKVKAALAEIGTRFDQALLSVDLLVQQLYNFITFDPALLEDENGYLTVSLSKLPPEVRQCIAGWEVEEKSYRTPSGDIISERKTKVKWIDKLKAVEHGMKWRKMLTGDSVTVNDNRQTFNWQQFYDNPPNVVDQRMKEAIEDAKTKKLTKEDSES